MSLFINKKRVLYNNSSTFYVYKLCVDKSVYGGRRVGRLGARSRANGRWLISGTPLKRAEPDKRCMPK